MKLFIQHMSHFCLSETFVSIVLVTDSAADMTAVVTGQKTNNGVLSESFESVPGVKDGTPLKTFLEYAEERGRSTGIISNMSMPDATPAAFYAHVNDRSKNGNLCASPL